MEDGIVVVLERPRSYFTNPGNVWEDSWPMLLGVANVLDRLGTWILACFASCEC